MKILLVGSEGNIGTSLRSYLKECGHTVICADLLGRAREDYQQIDITDPNELYCLAIKERPSVIFNLAALVSRVTCERAASMAIDRNVSGTNNLIQIAKVIEAKLVVFSTSEVYGDKKGILREENDCYIPNNRYGLTKWFCEELTKYEVAYHNLNAVIVRPFMFYHERENIGLAQSAMIRFAHDLFVGKKIEVHRGSKRGWTHIDDAVVALERVIYLDKFVSINIGNPEIIDTEDLALKFCNLYGINYIDWVEEVELPKQMTLVKYPELKNQYELLNFTPKIKIDEGVLRVANRIRRDFG